MSVREKILEELSTTDLFDKKEIELINKLKEKEVLKLEKESILSQFTNLKNSEVIKESMTLEIYQLFPYCSPAFDPQESYEEVLKSLINLNTRLSNLQKINKSLDNFINDSNSLNWSELQNINTEIVDED